VRTRPVARSTTGLDLKRLFIGTEGTFGVVTAATLRVFPVPEREEIHGFSFRDFATGFGCLARIYDSGLAPSVMDFEETFPAPTLPWWSEEGPPALYLGFAGSREIVAASWRLARRHLRGVAARPLPDREAKEYWKTRHDIIYAHDEISPGVTRADLFLNNVIFDYVHVALPRSRVLSYRGAPPSRRETDRIRRVDATRARVPRSCAARGRRPNGLSDRRGSGRRRRDSSSPRLRWLHGVRPRRWREARAPHGR